VKDFHSGHKFSI